MAASSGAGDGWLSLSRKIAFVAGLLGVGYETIFEDVDRPWLFLVFLTMMGLAQFGRVLELLSKKPGGGVTIRFDTKDEEKPDPLEKGSVP